MMINKWNAHNTIKTLRGIACQGILRISLCVVSFDLLGVGYDRGKKADNPIIAEMVQLFWDVR